MEPSQLWNRRLAHVHYRALPIAIKVVLGLPEIQTKHEGICKGCAQGKNVKKTFPNNESKAKGILDIIHSDVFIPMSSNSLRRYVYYVSFIDDFPVRLGFISRKVKMSYLASSRNSKPWSKITLRRRSRPYNQIMVENSFRKNSRIFAENLRLRGS